MPNLRSSPSPEQSHQSITKKKGKKKGKTPKKKSAVPPEDDAESRDVRQPSPETDDSSTGSAGFVDKELDSLETQKADITRKRQELDAAEARFRKRLSS